MTPHSTTAAATRRSWAVRTAALAVAVFAFATPSALASSSYTSAGSFGSAGSGAGQLSGPQGVAVGSSGNVYVADSGNNRIDEFDSSDHFVLAFGKGVDQTSGGDVCTAASGDTCQAGTRGSAPGEFTTAEFVAVDNSGGPSNGDVYVGDTGDNLVSKFDSSGNLITSWGTGGQLNGSTAPGGPFGAIDGITVDAAGNLLVINASNVVFRFAQDGSSPASFATTRGMDPNGLAVNSSGNLFKVNGDGSTEQLTGAGSDVGQVTSDSATAIAVDPATGDLFVNTGSAVDRYVFDSSGHVLEPGSSTCTVAPFTGCSPTGSFGAGTLTGGSGVGVNPATGVVYVAEGSANKVQIFALVTLPDVTTAAASNVGETTTTLNGTVNPDGVPVTDCHFDYGTTSSYGQSAPCIESVGSGSSAASVHADLTGLTSSTTYHFRLEASNTNGTSFGTDQTLTTEGPPVIDSQSASNLNDTIAQLHAQIKPDGADTSCHFQYGTDTNYTGGRVPCAPADLGSGLTDQSAHAWLTGLQPGTTYHYRVIATNSIATVTGSDQTFTTPIAPVAAPAFALRSVAYPTNFAPGDKPTVCAVGGSELCSDSYSVVVTNGGSAVTDGSPVTISDTLPAGMSIQSIQFYWSQRPFTDINAALGVCTTAPLQCTLPSSIQSALGPMRPGDTLRMFVLVAVDQSAATGPITNSVSVSGGGAPDVSATGQNAIATQPAAFGLQDLSASLTGVDGTADTQAGSHPYEFTTTVDLNTEHGAKFGDPKFGGSAPVQDAKDLMVDLPRGVVGDPQAMPQCSLSRFQGGQGCPADTQVGTLSLIGGEGAGCGPWCSLFNLTPPQGVAGEFGFYSAGTPVTFTAGVRAGDYGLRTASIIPATLGLMEVSVTLWGVPADPSHDAQRCGGRGDLTQCSGPLASGAPALPFLTNPTDCSASGSAIGVSTDAWQNQGAFQTATAALPTMTGCDALSFDPTLAVAPDTTQAGAPAGLSVDLKVPQTNDPNQLATPELRDATVTLPEGMTVNPSSGDGLAGCSDQQIDLGSLTPATCPDASKIGSVQLHTPLLDHPLPGDVFLGTPECNPCSPSDAASGKMVRLFIQVDDPISGIVVKLAGSVSIDQSTGQLTTTFKQNPQLPFDELQLTLKGGPRAPLVNPSTCGTFTTTSDLAPWSAPFSGADATPSSTFDVTGCGDPNTFAPTFTAGTQNAQAGAYSPFTLSFQRSDADQFFQGLAVKLPLGLTAKLAGVPLCSDSDANAGTCPAGSQVGTVETGAGAGSEPLFLPGKAYLTGPYKGAPYGMAVVVPAIAGPYNLGTVVVRQALHVDPETTQVTAVSDPFPTQLDGIPLRLRRVDVALNRPGFTLNPTSCNPSSIGGVLSSTGGMVAGVSSHFQVGGCQDLGFAPKLKFALTGKGKTVSGDHPTLTATLTQGAGQANIKSAKVALPLSLALDPNNSQHVCDYNVAKAVHGGAVGCPASTIVGKATAVTPLLDKPLTGPVYLVQGIRFGKQGQRIRTLPTLLVPLRGQIALDLRAQSAVNGAQQLVTTFSAIPDAPVSSFTLEINGGPKGLLVITGRGLSICKGPQVANASFGAQSGKATSQNDTLATPCGTPASLQVLSHRVKGNTLVLGVRTSERGRLTVTGQGLRTFSRVLGTGTHQIRVALKHRVQSKRRASTASMQVQVTLTPANAQGATHTFRQRE